MLELEQSTTMLATDSLWRRKKERVMLCGNNVYADDLMAQSNA